MAVAPIRLAEQARATDRAERRLRRVIWLAFFAATAALWWPAEAARIKEVASVAGCQCFAWPPRSAVLAEWQLEHTSVEPQTGVPVPWHDTLEQVFVALS